MTLDLPDGNPRLLLLAARALEALATELSEEARYLRAHLHDAGPICQWDPEEALRRLTQESEGLRDLASRFTETIEQEATDEV